MLTSGNAEGQIFSFQDGANGYAGTVDTEFRDTDPVNAATPTRGTQIVVSIDQADSDVPGQPGRTQGAIRFDDIIGNLPGQVPSSTLPQEVLFADVVVYVRSATAIDAEVTFDRVLGVDQGTSCSVINDPTLCDPNEPAARPSQGQLWDESDSWFSLGGSVVGVPNPLDPNFAILPFDPIETGNSDVLGVGAEATFSSEDPSNPGDGRLLEEFNFVTNDFVSIEVTDSVRKYLAGEPNAGWAINSTSGNGWDFYSADYSFADAAALGGAEAALVSRYQDVSDLNLDEVELRPQLRVVLGANGDLDFDGDIDNADFDTLRSRLGTRNPSRERGLNGDLNFDFDVDLNDFALFKDAFDAANGVGSFALMVAGVPEPTTLLISLAAMCALPRRR